MIFKGEMCKLVLSGQKTQTRRPVKRNELASGNRVGSPRINAVWIDTKGIHDKRQEQHGFIRAPLTTLESLYRLKWHVAMGFYAGKTYAVQPGRGQPTIMYHIDPSGNILEWDWSRADSRLSVAETRQKLKSLGWREARIRITEIRREQLQDISHEDIQAEGIPKSLCMYYDDEGYKDFDTEEHRGLFQELWNSIHKKPGARWEDNPDVWVLTFEVVDG